MKEFLYYKTSYPMNFPCKITFIFKITFNLFAVNSKKMEIHLPAGHLQLELEDVLLDVRVVDLET